MRPRASKGITDLLLLSLSYDFDRVVDTSKKKRLSRYAYVYVCALKDATTHERTRYRAANQQESARNNSNTTRNARKHPRVLQQHNVGDTADVQKTRSSLTPMSEAVRA